MNKKNRKGFTIVELVIVIAVIGILATVLVPTFGDVISNAKQSAALQGAKSAYTNYVQNHVADEGFTTDGVLYVEYDNMLFKVEDGQMEKTASTPTACYKKLAGGTVSNVAVSCPGEADCAIH